MNISKETMLEKLFEIYSHQYDIDRTGVNGGGVFPATATYFLRDENYLISKKHVLNAVENYDYVYFCLADHLDAPTLQKYIDHSLQLGRERITPHKEHMSSFITLILLADTIDDEAKRMIQKKKLKKYFRLAFHGWMEYHISAVEISTKQFLSNPAGRETRKLLQENFGSGPQKKGVLKK